MTELIRALAQYRMTWGRRWDADRDRTAGLESRFLELMKSPHCFERTHRPGHMTGSAVITTPDLNRVLLTLHRKLNLWLQLGGHADGNPRLDEVALREAQEESGLTALSFLRYGSVFELSPETTLAPILDLDIHLIPANPKEPEHEHFDARYLIVASDPEAIQISEESRDLRWFPIDDAYRITSEPGMHRLFEKLDFIRNSLRQAGRSSRDCPANSSNS